MVLSTLLWHIGALFAILGAYGIFVKREAKLFICKDVLLPLAWSQDPPKKWQLLRALRHFERELNKVGGRNTSVRLVLSSDVPDLHWALAVQALWLATQGIKTDNNQSLMETLAKDWNPIHFSWKEDRGLWQWQTESTSRYQANMAQH